MPEISAEQVKQLREATGAGVLDCKKALQETDGDFEQAREELRKRGLAEARQKSGRSTDEGIVEAYIHLNGKIGVLVEMNSETDFVARTDEFKELAHNICMQIAAADPDFISREDVPEDIVKQEKTILRQQAEDEGKPEHVIDQIVEGRLDKFYSQVCLMDQTYIKDTEMTVEELINDAIATLGENIRVDRFARFAVGEDD